MRILAVLACVVLAEQVVVRQLEPQRVEHVTRTEWCLALDGSAGLWRVTGSRVDGEAAGKEDREEVYRLPRGERVWNLTGGS